MKTRFIFLFLACTFLTTSLLGSVASGGSVSYVTRLDLSNGRVSGERVDYKINLPTKWSGYLISERERPGSDTGILEKINFYYQPQNKLSKPVFLLSVYLYEKKSWWRNKSARMILETDDYVFAAVSASSNPLSNKTDKAIFASLLSDAQNDDFLFDLIQLPLNQRVVFYNTVTVNGVRLKDSPVLIQNNVTYVPVRKTCEALGYKIGWLPKEQVVTVSKGSFYTILFTRNNDLNKGFVTLSKNQTVYVSSLFFIQVLKKNVETDEKNNVYIND